MSLATRFRKQRGGVESVLFWASSLAESQRTQAVSLPPPPAVAGCDDATPVDPQQRHHMEEEEEEGGREDAEMQTVTANGRGETTAEQKEDDEANVSGCQQEQQQQQSTVPTDIMWVQDSPATSSVSRTDAAMAVTSNVSKHKGDYCRFKDVLTVCEPLLQGLLGPVGIDVEMNGTTAMLRDPNGFTAALDTLEKASCDSLRHFHDSIQLFFIIRGDSFYTLDSSVCSPLVFLAKLLSVPAVTKIVHQAQPMYRLLFMFLGTDRVEVRNLVDISVWSAVVERVCGPRPYTKGFADSQSLWQSLPESSREIIEVQLEKAKQERWCENTLKAEESEATMMMLSSSLPSSSGEMPLSQLLGRFKSLAALYAYYEAYLHSVESSGATGNVSMSLFTVCSLETRVSFLCEVMSYHGMFVEKNVLDCMVADLEQQIKALIEKGNVALQAMATSSNECIDMETVDAWNLIKTLQSHFGGPWTFAKGNVEEQLQQIGAYLDEKQGCTDSNVARIWLALHERREFKRSLMDGFTKGASIHARLIAIPEEMASTEGGGQSNPQHVGAQHRLFFSVHPKWSVHHATTARLFCSRPCLQTVAKNPPISRTAPSSSPPVTIFSNPEWTLRHLYGPPPGCTLVSFDFNQIELRVLAHLSGDSLLLQQLRAGSDVLAEMALRVMQLPRLEDVTPYLRQGTKVVVYGLLYGMGPESLDLRLRQLHKETTPSAEQPPLSARQFLRSFHQCYPAVQGFLKSTRLRAFHEKRCATLNGLRDLSGEPDGNRRKQAAVASAIQGGAAVILHHAIVEVHEKRHELVPCLPAAAVALVLSVHDELVYAVPDSAVSIVAPKIKEILEQQAAALSLSVPLPVSMKAGKSFGSLQSVPV
ncbi:mitochondrial DNA polymerase I protein A, putative [Trypanosoma cruzi marinkellei]|uniref:Mitochondrial DNA polymerase I protein A, putative n=1 Tax=Trypanosoma cruzi marinkellei TaxID=85056 RepID=K2NWL3_TRYCR|nr:mitochondrial DNA polymerase I protein A, putative [Trypanosoma cruzi marinkellei]